jgi:hypothetical protein
MNCCVPSATERGAMLRYTYIACIVWSCRIAKIQSWAGSEQMSLPSNASLNILRIKLLWAVLMNIQLFWDMTPCRLVCSHVRFWDYFCSNFRFKITYISWCSGGTVIFDNALLNYKSVMGCLIIKKQSKVTLVLYVQFFRRFCLVAKNSCYLRHVRPSDRVYQRRSHWTDF